MAEETTQGKISLILDKLNNDIKLRSNLLFLTGFVVLIICISLAFYIYSDIKDVLTTQIDKIDNAKDGQKALLITIYLVFRILTLGTIPTALLIFGYNIVRASFDQSVRFAKRKHGALFWQFLHDEYEDKVQDITFDKFKDAFDAWNKTTESSFTNINVSSRNHFGNSLENISGTLKELKEKIDKK
jgi:hypothetical protein